MRELLAAGSKARTYSRVGLGYVIEYGAEDGRLAGLGERQRNRQNEEHRKKKGQNNDEFGSHRDHAEFGTSAEALSDPHVAHGSEKECAAKE